MLLQDLIFYFFANQLRVTDSVKCDTTTHLGELAAQLRTYFPETEESDSWIRYPFSAVPAALTASEQ